MGSQETTCSLQETRNLGPEPASTSSSPPPNLHFSFKQKGLFIGKLLENKNWNACLLLSQDFVIKEKGVVIRAPEITAIFTGKKQWNFDDYVKYYSNICMYRWQKVLVDLTNT